MGRRQASRLTVTFTVVQFCHIDNCSNCILTQYEILVLRTSTVKIKLTSTLTKYQKIMTLKRLSLVHSWGFFSKKTCLFGCNVARAFFRSCSFDSFLSTFGHKIGVLKLPQLCFKEKSCKLHAARSCASESTQLLRTENLNL